LTHRDKEGLERGKDTATSILLWVTRFLDFELCVGSYFFRATMKNKIKQAITKYSGCNRNKSPHQESTDHKKHKEHNCHKKLIETQANQVFIRKKDI
jgi:hypothetical protein